MHLGVMIFWQPLQKRDPNKDGPPMLSAKIERLAQMQQLSDDSSRRRREDLQDRDAAKVAGQAAIMAAVVTTFASILKPAVPEVLPLPQIVPAATDEERNIQIAHSTALTQKLQGKTALTWIEESTWFQGFEEKFSEKLSSNMISTKMLISTFSKASSNYEFAQKLPLLTEVEANAIFSYFSELLEQ